MKVGLTAQFWLRVLIVGSGLAGLLIGSHRLAFYTSQSNIITLGYFGGVLYWMLRRRTTDPAAPRLRGAVTLWIVITGLISHFMLQNGENPLPGLAAADPAERVVNLSAFLVHYVVPTLVLLDWLAFGPRRVSPWRDLPLWILFPLGYGAASVARAVAFPTVSDRYPYFFLDPTAQGYGWVAGQFVRLAVIFGVLGALLLAYDRLAARVAARFGRAKATPSGSAPAQPGPDGSASTEVDSADGDAVSEPARTGSARR